MQGYDRRVSDTTNATDYLVRRYTADSFREAVDAYEANLRDLADLGYRPVTQVWGWDTTSSAGWIFGGSSWKPGRGTLAVTYWRIKERP
jgi:hypothetical protein